MAEDAAPAGAAGHRLLIDPQMDHVAYLGALSPALRTAALGRLGLVESEALDRAWPLWAHDGQLAPPACADGSDWATWVLMGGRGFGKTLAGAQWLTERIAAGGALSIALVAASLDEARRVMVEGRSGLLTVAAPWVESWQPSRRELRFTTGALATLFSGASPDLLRGPEHHLAWCDELAKWERAGDCWDMLQLGLRLGAWPRALVTTTPRAGPVLHAIMAAPATVVTRGPTRANPHLSAAWKARVEAQYAGTRLGAQELDGALLPEAGALWTPALLARCRVDRGAGEAAFARVLIAVDPPAKDGTCGIVACALAADGVAHVLADHSVAGRSPEGWAQAVADAAAAHGTREVVAEVNQGGRMVKAVLLTACPGLQVRLVTATTGKSARAEPVAMLFEAGKARLHGRMPELEAQLCGLIAGGGYRGPGGSPDRADAMVWGVAEVTRGRPAASVRGM